MVLSISSALIGQNETERGYIVSIGDSVPEFSLEFTDSSKTTMDDLKGDVIMLQFTASWCSVCRKEMPHIEKEIWNIYKDLYPKNRYFELKDIINYLTRNSNILINKDTR